MDWIIRVRRVPDSVMIGQRVGLNTPDWLASAFMEPIGHKGMGEGVFLFASCLGAGKQAYRLPRF